ncbi:hypothetical protein EWM64_g5231 [Hericium alpestre]|uniref:Uncharacterized protein n=1 Tax=Hericium alpestre TaxID=135208 RepID=A0A4Y9ZX63_9AGAM|nr:hypothetical protein EWM64_g5231 [Hericium alpestre]
MDNFDFCILLFPLARVAFYTLCHVVFYLRLLAPVLGPILSPFIYASIFGIFLSALSARYEALQKSERLLAQADPSKAKAGEAALSSFTVSDPEASVTALVKSLIGIFVAPLHPGRGFPPGTRYNDVLPVVGLEEATQAPAPSGEDLTPETACEDVLPSAEEPTPAFDYNALQGTTQKDMPSQTQELEDVPPLTHEVVPPQTHEHFLPHLHEDVALQTHEDIAPSAQEVALEPDSLKESGGDLLSQTLEGAEQAELEYRAPGGFDEDVLPQTFEYALPSAEQDAVGQEPLEIRSGGAVPPFNWGQIYACEGAPPPPEITPALFEQGARFAHDEDLPPPQNDAGIEDIPSRTSFSEDVLALFLGKSNSTPSQSDAAKVPETTNNDNPPALDADAGTSDDEEDEVSEPPQGEAWQSYRDYHGPCYIDDGPTQEEMHAAYLLPPPAYSARDPCLMDWEPVPPEQCVPNPWSPPVDPNVQVLEMMILDLSGRVDRLSLGPEVNEMPMDVDWNML